MKDSTLLAESLSKSRYRIVNSLFTPMNDDDDLPTDTKFPLEELGKANLTIGPHEFRNVMFYSRKVSAERQARAARSYADRSVDMSFAKNPFAYPSFYAPFPYPYPYFSPYFYRPQAGATNQTSTMVPVVPTKPVLSAGATTSTPPVSTSTASANTTTASATTSTTTASATTSTGTLAPSTPAATTTARPAFPSPFPNAQFRPGMYPYPVPMNAQGMPMYYPFGFPLRPAYNPRAPATTASTTGASATSSVSVTTPRPNAPTSNAPANSTTTAPTPIATTEAIARPLPTLTTSVATPTSTVATALAAATTPTSTNTTTVAPATAAATTKRIVRQKKRKVEIIFQFEGSDLKWKWPYDSMVDAKETSIECIVLLPDLEKRKRLQESVVIKLSAWNDKIKEAFLEHADLLSIQNFKDRLSRILPLTDRNHFDFDQVLSASKIRDMIEPTEDKQQVKRPKRPSQQRKKKKESTSEPALKTEPDSEQVPIAEAEALGSSGQVPDELLVDALEQDDMVVDESQDMIVEQEVVIDSPIIAALNSEQ